MNYTSRLSEEIMRISCDDKSACAFLSGVFRCVGEMEFTNKGFRYLVYDDNMKRLLKISELIELLVGESLSINVISGEAGKKSVYGEILASRAKELLKKVKIISYGKKSLENLNLNVDFTLDDDFKYFILGILFVATNLYLPDYNDRSKEYRLEMMLRDESTSKYIINKFKKKGLLFKAFEKNEDSYNISLTSVEDIKMLFSLINLDNLVLELANLQFEREVQNDINRRANFSVANMIKTSNANIKQLKAIQAIKDNGLYNNLDDILKSTAESRCANKTASMEELAKILGITKSGVKHRLNKLIEIAEENNILGD